MRINRGWIFALLAAIMLCLGGCEEKDSGGVTLQYTPLYKYDINAGMVTGSADNKEAVADGEEVTLRAQANEGYTFIGWTTGDYLEFHGELVSEDAEFTFVKNGQTKYYANFLAENQVIVCYYANGGTMNHAEAKDDRLIQKITLNKHKYPMTFPQNGTFSREGYVLTEYTSEADGSGTVTNIGQRVFSDSKIIHLYAQWAKETDADAFVFEDRNGEVFVVSYSGNDEVLTIPAQHNGKPVTGIASNAISSENLKTVVLPETITTIEEGAFTECTALHTLYLYDTVSEMTDKSFSNCPIAQVCLNSVYEKKYYAEGAGKLELLYSQRNAQVPKLIIVSGSSGIYGVDSNRMEEALTRDLDVVNFALQIGIPSSFSMRILEDYLKAGDIVLMAPECEFKQFGNELTTTAFVKFDGAYTCIRNVDLRAYSSFFDALAAYSMAKEYDSESLHNEVDQYYEENGDAANNKESQAFPATYTFRSPTERAEMTTETYGRINTAIALLNQKGVDVYLTFAPFCTEACEDEVTEDMLDAYSQTLAENLNVTCISTQSAHNYAMKYFFEMFHMTAEGKQLRTEQLITELNAHFAQGA